LCLFVGPFVATADAGLAVPIPIIWGKGETVAQVGELPPEVQQEATRELGANVSVGFIYNRFHIYYADLWTWNGRHVLYTGDKYLALDAAQWQELIGESAESKYGKPFRYRFPLGIVIIAALGVVSAIRPYVFPSDARRIEKLLNDPSYRNAINSLFPTDRFPLRVEYDAEEYDRAIASLTAAGISETKAKKNLDLLAGAVKMERAHEITVMFQTIDQFRQIGATAEAIALLEKMQVALPHGDSLQEYIGELLGPLREQMANAANTEDPEAEPREESM
jgi:hypothetical protein